MATSIIQPFIAPPFDQAYGPNPVTLTGIPFDPVTGALTADKYVLQIWRNGQLIADLRQTPNAVGNAIFDIQNTLQNFVAPSPNNVEEVGYLGSDLMNSANESTPYNFKTGYESNGAVTIDNQPGQIYLDFGGTKKYYEVPYTTITYIPTLTEFAAGCTTILKQQQPFTAMKQFRLGADITDGKPAWLTNTMRVYDHYVTLSDMTTISYYNSVNGTGPALAKSIDAFVFWQYDTNTLLGVNQLYNTVGNGGGPNTVPAEGLTPAYPTRAITCGTGPLNFQDLDPLATHYYVATAPYTGAGCPNQTIGGLADGSMHYVHRFNIIQEGCNDFPEYQFSWLNEYGFRDYYSFRKRKDRGVKINRNEYLKEAANYNASTYVVNIYDRGTTVFSQTLPEEFSAFTGFISDADALYLEGLFISADVKVRFNDSDTPTKWVPVSLMSTDYVEKTVRKDKLFQYDIKFKLAHNIKSQRG